MSEQLPVRERGSVLMLMPAAVLVFLVLGALAVDAAVVFLAEREVANMAAAAANDAAASAIDVEHFYADGSTAIDPARVRRAVEEAVRSKQAGWLHDLEVDVDIRQDDEPVVLVAIRAEVSYVFAGAVPGGPERAAVGATATATARRR